MTDLERKKYLEAYYDNEADANRQMSFANIAAAVLTFAIWMCYVTGIFKIVNLILPVVNIIFPIGILLLLSPMFIAIFFKHLLRKKNYKYYVIFTLILTMAAINIILPKHTVIGWALCLVITNHYYNPKVGIFTFIVVLVLSLMCLYASMFFGEYDPNLLGIGSGVSINANGDIDGVYGWKERYDMLHELLVNGDNRYLKAFVNFYLSRLALLSIIFMVCTALNIRTYKLFLRGFKINSEQEKTKTELEVAKEIQLNTLPPEFVSNKDIEIQAQLMPAKEVGGDFYDYFFLDKDHIALVIADVSGKGIPAAMFMMKTITCFKNYVSIDKSPAETLKQVNQTINKDNDSNMFVTCFYAIVNTKTGEMKFANAGHNHPIVGQPKKYHFLDCQNGFVLGPMKDLMVVDETYQLSKGDTLTLYTDGITEARNPKGELYSQERLIKKYNEKEYSCLVELHYTIKDDVERFANGEDQADDMTYITLKYHGDKYNFKETTFKGIQDNLPKMLDYIKQYSKDNKFDETFTNNLMVVADEMLSNVVKYGYQNYVDEIFIRLLYNVDRNEFILTIIDKGEQFNPFTIDNKPLEGDISNKKEGGLGILIVKTLMSEYAYDYINHKNIVTLKKKF